MTQTLEGTFTADTQPDSLPEQISPNDSKKIIEENAERSLTRLFRFSQRSFGRGKKIDFGENISLITGKSKGNREGSQIVIDGRPIVWVPTRAQDIATQPLQMLDIDNSFFSVVHSLVESNPKTLATAALASQLELDDWQSNRPKPEPVTKVQRILRIPVRETTQAVQHPDIDNSPQSVTEFMDAQKRSVVAVLGEDKNQPPLQVFTYLGESVGTVVVPYKKNGEKLEVDYTNILTLEGTPAVLGKVEAALLRKIIKDRAFRLTDAQRVQLTQEVTQRIVQKNIGKAFSGVLDQQMYDLGVIQATNIENAIGHPESGFTLNASYLENVENHSQQLTILDGEISVTFDANGELTWQKENVQHRDIVGITQSVSDPEKRRFIVGLARGKKLEPTQTVVYRLDEGTKAIDVGQKLMPVYDPTLRQLYESHLLEALADDLPNEEITILEARAIEAVREGVSIATLIDHIETIVHDEGLQVALTDAVEKGRIRLKQLYTPDHHNGRELAGGLLDCRQRDNGIYIKVSLSSPDISIGPNRKPDHYEISITDIGVKFKKANGQESRLNGNPIADKLLQEIITEDIPNNEWLPKIQAMCEGQISNGAMIAFRADLWRDMPSFDRANSSNYIIVSDGKETIFAFDTKNLTPEGKLPVYYLKASPNRPDQWLKTHWERQSVDNYIKSNELSVPYRVPPDLADRLKGFANLPVDAAIALTKGTEINTLNRFDIPVALTSIRNVLRNQAQERLRRAAAAAAASITDVEETEENDDIKLKPKTEIVKQPGRVRAMLGDVISRMRNLRRR